MPVDPASAQRRGTIHFSLSLILLLVVIAGCHAGPFGPFPSIGIATPTSIATQTPVQSASSMPSPTAVAIRQMTMGISTPNGLADKDAREGEIIESLDDLAKPLAEGGIGRYPGAFGLWTNFVENSSRYGPRASFPTSTLTAALDERRITPIVFMQPVGPGIERSGGNTLETATRFANSSIAEGSFDDYLTDWANGAAAFGKTVILRYAWEMNGSWFPWSPTQDRARYFDLRNSPQSYVQAWRHVHDVIHAIAPNVKFFWCPTVTGIETAPAFFPGANYVDYIGLDGYERSKTNEPMMQLFGQGFATLRSLPGAEKIPMLIGETGIVAGNPHREAWLRDGYRRLYNAWPGLAGIIYFDFNMADVFGQQLEKENWALVAAPEIRTAYATLGADQRYQGTLSSYR